MSHNSAVKVIKNTLSNWSVFQACLDLRLLGAVNWAAPDARALLSEILECNARRNKDPIQGGGEIWGGLKNSNFNPRQPNSQNTPLWETCLFDSNGLALFVAMVNDNVLTENELEALQNTPAFQNYCLQDNMYGFLKRITAPSFQKTKAWMEDYHDQNVWMTVPHAKARAKKIAQGLSPSEVQKWGDLLCAEIKAQNFSLISSEVLTSSDGVEAPIMLLSAAQRTALLEQTTPEWWKHQVRNREVEKNTEWLRATDSQWSVSAINMMMGILEDITRYNGKDKHHRAMRVGIKKAAINWLSTQKTHHAEIFQKMLCIWQNSDIQKEELTQVFNAMKSTTCPPPWQRPSRNLTVEGLEIALASFVTHATAKEIGEQFESILQGVLNKPRNDFMMLDKVCFALLKDKTEHAQAKHPYLSQLVWTLALNARGPVVSCRIKNLAALKDAKDHPRGANVYHAPVCPNMLEAACEALKKVSLDNAARAEIEKAILVFHLEHTGQDPVSPPSTRRKM